MIDVLDMAQLGTLHPVCVTCLFIFVFNHEVGRGRRQTPFSASHHFLGVNLRSTTEKSQCVWFTHYTYFARKLSNIKSEHLIGEKQANGASLQCQIYEYMHGYVGHVSAIQESD